MPRKKPGTGQARTAARPRTMAETMDLISAISDDTDTEELWSDGMRDIDDQRPEGSKLFEELRQEGVTGRDPTEQHDNETGSQW